MILSRMFINKQRRDAKKLLVSPQAMHAAVLSGFPPDVDQGRVLWRLDGMSSPQTSLWIVSRERPDLTHLEEQAGWPSRPTTRSENYDGVLAALAPNQSWAFRATVNPTHRGNHAGRKQIFAHVTVEQQTQWLLDRQDRMGVSLLGPDKERTFGLTSRDVKKFKRGDASVTLAYATFEGVLRVVNAERLRSVLVEGLGRGKAYGCGLVTLARPA
ncbi:type I-E CRISPR-associated protein Cas6/Cse3/CasE [Enemella evansiae]|uniref:type I-E CRISPR-associated protein Cas6/Cse3/CasE n=1 Tax=Enemella evansiae TaxID=2016499 RepID=UPI000B96556A|nr:type I-E CRISPR-associated protein Cas6/Cse3/CasE [Enemella evansiae]OYO16963.1 type I-E CRISPR-associated protein Cas6/Cse3/CasE [Enemella evansiae]